MKRINSLVVFISPALYTLSSLARQQFISQQDYYEFENKIALKMNSAIDSFRWDLYPERFR